MPERAGAPRDSEARLLARHETLCSLPSLRRRPVRRMLPWWAYVYKYTYTLGYKAGILRVPVVSRWPLGDRTELRKVGAWTFLSVCSRGTRLSRAPPPGCLAYLWVPWVTVLYVGTTYAPLGNL